MASRTSVYTNALKLPDWVLGGEFGDLSRVMNSRDLSYENVEQSEQLNDQREYTLEDLERKKNTRETLSTKLGGKAPATVREAYEKMIEAAYEAGDPIAAMEYQAKVNDYDQAQVARRRKDFADAVGIADNTSYDRIEEMYPGILSRDDYNRNQKRTQTGTGVKSSDMVEVMNTQTGAKDRIPWTEARKAQELGWEVEPSASRQDEIRQAIERRREEIQSPPKQSWGDYLGGIFNPTAAQPMSAPQDGKGDRARQGPKVGDEVKIIKRERSVTR